MPGLSAPADGRPTAFVSYARQDRPVAAKVVAALEAAGVAVWWDGMIAGGEAFASTIEQRLDTADAVIVLWSATSIRSDWVRDEAAHGRDRGCFVAVSLDGSQPPLGFRQYHAIDLSGWNGSPAAPAFQLVLKGIGQARSPDRGEAPAVLPLLRAPARWSRRRVMACGAGIAATGALGLSVWRFGLDRAPDNSIAVLPFRNLDATDRQGWFPDGLTDEIRVRLLNEAHLSVAAPTSSNLFRAASQDAREVAAKLGVGWLLEGAVRRAENALRITVSLINGRTGLSHWSQNYERAAQDVFDIERDVSRSIAEAVAGRASPALQKAAGEIGGTDQIAAHDLYLQAKGLFAAAQDETGFRQALTMADQALGIDPDYARAHLLRGRILIAIRNSFTPSGPELARLTDLALAAVRRSLQLVPELAEAYVELGYTLLSDKLDYRLPGPLYERARQMAPGDAEIARAHAHLLYRMGRNAEAVAAIALARRLDPLNPIVFRVAGLIDFVGGRTDAARAGFLQALGLNPQVSLAHAGLGDIALQARDAAGAREAFTREPLEPLRLSGLACAAHLQGDRQAAQGHLSALRRLGDIAVYQVAQALAWLGEGDAALAALDRAYRLKDPGLLAIGIDFKFAAIRDRPSFRRLMAQMGLAPA